MIRMLFKTFFREMSDVKNSKYKSILWDFLLIFIFGGILPIASVFMPRYIIAFIEENKPFNDLLYVIIFFTVVIVVCGFVSVFVTDSCKGKTLGFRIREFIEFFKIYLVVDYEKIEDPNWIDLIQRQSRALNSDGSGYQGTLDTFLTILPNAFTSLVFIVLLSMISPFLIIFVLLYLVLATTSAVLGAKYEYSKRKDMTHHFRKEEYYTKAASDFSYAKDIRVYNLSDKLLSLIRFELNSLKKIYNQISRHVFLYSILECLSMLLLFGFTMYFSLHSFISTGSISTLLFNIMVVTTLIPLLTNIITKVLNLVRCIKEVEEYYQFKDENFKEREEKNSIEINEPLEIEFKNVSFKYPRSETYVFENLSFKINAKEKIAIVGVNGAGKTTIVKLIVGFFKPTSGEILINGRNISEFNIDDLYKLFAVVFQDFNVYAFSILENVSLNFTDKTDREKVIDILKREELYDYISTLKNKEDQVMLKYLDPEGVEMSGGQTQKLAIARALYKDKAYCVILDEPTAALDALAEAKIYESFSDLVENKTAIYISHRLSSTRFCDRIMLFGDGKLLEDGSHDELMALKGQYYNLFKIQGKYYQNGGEDIENTSGVN